MGSWSIKGEMEKIEGSWGSDVQATDRGGRGWIGFVRLAGNVGKKGRLAVEKYELDSYIS
jgi:hypothetical protein